MSEVETDYIHSDTIFHGCENYKNFYCTTRSVCGGVPRNGANSDLFQSLTGHDGVFTTVNRILPEYINVATGTLSMWPNVLF